MAGPKIVPVPVDLADEALLGTLAIEWEMTEQEVLQRLVTQRLKEIADEAAGDEKRGGRRRKH